MRSEAIEAVSLHAFRHLLGRETELQLQNTEHVVLGDQKFLSGIDEGRLFEGVRLQKFTVVDIVQQDATRGLYEDAVQQSEHSLAEEALGSPLAGDDPGPPLLSVSFKWHFCSEHGIQGHSQGPHVHQLGIVLSLHPHLGRSVGGRPADGPSQSFLKIEAAEAKVDQFCVPLSIEQNILGFDVPVRDSHAFEVEQGRQNLIDHPRRLPLGHGSILDDSFKEFAVGAILHEDVNVLLFPNHLVNLCDVFVHQSLLQQYFSLDGLHLLGVALIDFQDLYCHCLSGGFVDGFPDPAVSALADLLSWIKLKILRS